MPIVEEIPEALRAEVDAAVAWLSARRGAAASRSAAWSIPSSPSARRREAHELTLILCDGDLCVRERVRVRPVAAGFEIASADAAARGSARRARPEAGVRAGWLDAALAQHAFVVLVFYRGFW